MAEQMARPTSQTTIPSKRFHTKENAQLEIYGRLGKIHCRMINLSATGAFLEIVSSKFMPRQGDIARITVSLRQLNKTHTINAEVVWSKGLGIGITFLRNDEVYQKLATRSAKES